jgi:hypothetical protein
MDDVTPARLAENESMFRDANEGIEARAVELAFDGLVPFICECGRVACTEVVQLSRDEYESVRKAPRAFLVVPEHEITTLGGEQVGHVVRRTERYVVMEKLNDAGEVAEALDPRVRHGAENA